MTLAEAISGAISITLFYGFIKLTSYKRRYFFKHGIPDTALVTKVIKTGMNYGRGSYSMPVMDIVLEIAAADGKTKRLIVTQSFDRNHIPLVGDQLHILIDPKDAWRALIVSNFNGQVYRSKSFS